MATTVLVSSGCWQQTFISWLWREDLVYFLHFIICHVFGKDLIQVTLNKFKPVCLGQTLTVVTLNLDVLKAVWPCLIMLRKPLTPKACAGCLGFFSKESDLLNILNILRYILSVSSNFCYPSHIFRACPPFFSLFRWYSFRLWFMNINYRMLKYKKVRKGYLENETGQKK